VSSAPMCPVCGACGWPIADTVSIAGGTALTWECRRCGSQWERGAGFRKAAVYRVRRGARLAVAL